MELKKKHVVYSVEEAIRNLESFQSSNLSQRGYAKFSGIPESTLRGWM